MLDPNPAVQPPKWDWQLAVPIKINPDSTVHIYDIDMFENEKGGFPLTYEDQIYFNLWVAREAHARGMVVGCKNNINQAHDSRIYTAFDFVVSEQCLQYNECGYFSDFLSRNKPVFLAEYQVALSKICPKAKASRISAVKKRPALNARREDCSAYY